MRLLTVKIKNFRCYKEEITVPLSQLTALIAKNDAGKSSILDAIDSFFNKKKLEAGDRSISSSSSTPIEITCIFGDLPENIIVDSDNLIDPTVEYLLNKDRNLEITIQYKGTTPDIDSVQVNALTPTAENYKDLFDLTVTELRARAKQLGVDLTEVNKAIKSPIRHAIWNSVEPEALNIQLSKIEIKDTIWKALQNMLPLFQLFKADRPSTDQDAEAQDPIKFAIKESLSQIKQDLEQVEEHVKKQVEEVTRLTIEKIREMDESLANELNPVIKTSSWSSLFKVTLTNEEEIPLNKRGSGVRRLFLINFFRAKAEQQASQRHVNNIIFAIEEPETSQHPNNQFLLLGALRELSSEAGSQVIFTTHNPNLVGRIDSASLRFIDKREDGTRYIRENNDETLNVIAESLGIFANHNIKVFVGVEGPNDIEFLRRISKSLNNSDPAIPNLAEHEDNGDIIFIPMGGQTIEIWSSRLEELNIPEVHICDRDNELPQQPKYQKFADEVNARGRHCTAIVTDKREMENYLHQDAINSSLGITIGDVKDFDDIPTIAARMIHENSDSTKGWDKLTDEQKSEKKRQVKRRLNRDSVDYMTPELLKEGDKNGDVIRWLKKIKEHLE